MEADMSSEVFGILEVVGGCVLEVSDGTRHYYKTEEKRGSRTLRPKRNRLFSHVAAHLLVGGNSDCCHADVTSQKCRKCGDTARVGSMLILNLGIVMIKWL